MPVAPYDSKVPVMESLIPTLFCEQEKFLIATEKFENMYDPDDELEESDDGQKDHEESGVSEESA